MRAGITGVPFGLRWSREAVPVTGGEVRLELEASAELHLMLLSKDILDIWQGMTRLYKEAWGFKEIEIPRLRSPRYYLKEAAAHRHVPFYMPPELANYGSFELVCKRLGQKRFYKTLSLCGPSFMSPAPSGWMFVERSQFSSDCVNPSSILSQRKRVPMSLANYVPFGAYLHETMRAKVADHWPDAAFGRGTRIPDLFFGEKRVPMAVRHEPDGVAPLFFPDPDSIVIRERTVILVE